MFAYKNGPEITHLFFFIVDHLGHILARVDILNIQDFVYKNKTENPASN